MFEIQNLLNQKTQLAHGRRLKFFRNSELNITEEIKEHLQYQDNELLVVEDLEDIIMTDNGLEKRVKWQGFSETESCLLYTSPSPRDLSTSRMPSSA